MNQEQTVDAARLYGNRVDLYEKFVGIGRYPQALQNFFEQWPGLEQDQKILDAGCGTGLLTLALYRALQTRRIIGVTIKAFDLTPAMLSRFRSHLHEEGINDIELACANVLEPDALPVNWKGFDLVVSASMMEYVPRDDFAMALSGLRSRLRKDGKLLLFISRRNALMRPLIGRWWKANLYTKDELRREFRQAGFSHIQFRQFSGLYRYFNLWGHIVEAS